MPGARFFALAAFLAACFWPFPASADRSIDTRYATILYAEDTHLNDFLWRITGSRPMAGQEVEEPVKNRVDELVDRVEALLDMHPASFRFEIYLDPKAGRMGVPAHYSHGERRVHVSPATVTDGMLAHEIAHAVICAHFEVPPPEKSQEILARYVDENLWNAA